MPKNGKYLLDTNIIIALFNREQTVIEALAETDAILIPAIAVGELYFGARQSLRIEENIARIQDFIANMRVLPVNEQTANEYGIIKAQLKSKGTPIPDNDIWIAALAKQYSLTVVSRDKHLKSIDTIRVEIW